MAISMKQAAEELLKIADELDKDAAEVTEFVCDKCNHTATLATINGKRAELGKQAGENVVVSSISVEDKIACPACDGVMAYRATEASTPYYADDKAVTKEEIVEEKKETPEQQALEEQGKKLHDEPHKKEASVDYDSLNRYLGK
jgi:hypothetical protein